MLKKQSTFVIFLIALTSFTLLYFLMISFKENINSNTGSGLFPPEFFLYIVSYLAFLAIPTFWNIIGFEKALSNYKKNNNYIELATALLGFGIMELYILYTLFPVIYVVVSILF
jgi:hypothetical protein